MRLCDVEFVFVGLCVPFVLVVGVLLFACVFYIVYDLRISLLRFRAIMLVWDFDAWCLCLFAVAGSLFLFCYGKSCFPVNHPSRFYTPFRSLHIR